MKLYISKKHKPQNIKLFNNILMVAEEAQRRKTEFVDNIIEKVEEVQEAALPEIKASKVDEFMGIPIIHMEGLNASSLPIAVANKFGDYRFIAVNLRMLAEPYVKAVLCHEAGHHKLGHLDLPLKDRLNMNFMRAGCSLLGVEGQALRMEYEADEFSYFEGYNMVTALQLLKHDIPGLIFYPARKELGKRISSLRKQGFVGGTLEAKIRTPK